MAASVPLAGRRADAGAPKLSLCLPSGFRLSLPSGADPPRERAGSQAVAVALTTASRLAMS